MKPGLTRPVSWKLLACLGITLLGSCSWHSLLEREAEPIQPLAGYGSLDKFPIREAWYGIYLLEEKIGYSHFRIEPSGDRLTIHREAIMVLAAKQKTDELTVKERIVVRPDLTMVSFDSVERQNDDELHVTGKELDKRFVVAFKSGGKEHTMELPLGESLYHKSVTPLLLALKGIKEGPGLTFNVFNPNAQAMETVEQVVTMVKGPLQPNGAAWQVRSTIGRSVIYSWLNRTGLTVLERARDGDLITMLEDKSTAEKFQKKPERAKEKP